MLMSNITSHNFDCKLQWYWLITQNVARILRYRTVTDTVQKDRHYPGENIITKSCIGIYQAND